MRSIIKFKDTLLLLLMLLFICVCAVIDFSSSEQKTLASILIFQNISTNSKYKIQIGVAHVQIYAKYTIHWLMPSQRGSTAAQHEGLHCDNICHPYWEYTASIYCGLFVTKLLWWLAPTSTQKWPPLQTHQPALKIATYVCESKFIVF